MPLLKKRVFNAHPQHPAQAFYSADGLSTQIAPDGSTIMVDSVTGAYQESDGTWFSDQGVALSYYDPATGNYVEEGDPNSTLMDKDGNAVNPESASSGGGTAAAPAKSSGGFWSTLLNAATSLGSAAASKPTSTITPTYKPTVTTSNTGGLIVAVLVIGAVITTSVIIIRKSKKK